MEDKKNSKKAEYNEGQLEPLVMQREIKFRSYDTITKKMFNHKELLDLTLDGLTENLEQYPLMMFVGINDKNGKEIYEGDLIKAKYRDEILFGVVVFERGKFIGHRKRKAQNIDIYNTKNIEIIGSIFENPELVA